MEISHVWHVSSFHVARSFQDLCLTGADAAGIVDQVGAGVEGVVVGDRVFGNGRSTWAERAVLTSWAKMSDGLNFDQAAGYPLPAETAIRILSLAQVKPGETLLVNG